MYTDDGKKRTALFDFDGVVADTEAQYSCFWDERGRSLLGIENFASHIKGQTLVQIFDLYFRNDLVLQQQLKEQLDYFEARMQYDYVPGVVDFVNDVRRHGWHTAIVTSSDEAKMMKVYRVHPELRDMFDVILTSERFTRSKPAPDCFLLGMEVLGTTPQLTCVFEDSFHGLQAARESGAFVIGVATTNPRTAIEPLSHCVIDDFLDLTYEDLLTLWRV